MRSTDHRRRPAVGSLVSILVDRLYYSIGVLIDGYYWCGCSKIVRMFWCEHLYFGVKILIRNSYDWWKE